MPTMTAVSQTLVLFIGFLKLSFGQHLGNSRILDSGKLMKLKHERLNLIPTLYDKKLPPPKVNGKPLKVQVTMDVFSIPRFDEKAEDIMLEIKVTHLWVDARINVTLLENESVELDPRSIKEFWTPDSYFHHAKDAKFIDLMTPTAGLRVYPNKTIRYSTMVMLTLGCPMSFANFPMDTQNCAVELQSFGYDMRENTYDWLRPPRLMSGILIDNHEVNSSKYVFTYESDGYVYPGLGMNITLKRHLQFHMTQTYMPSIIFVIVAWLSFFVPSDIVPGRMVLCVTTLLTLTNMFSSVRSLTPQVSYMKAIDLWVFVCLIFVFSTLAEYALILHLTSRSNWQKTMDEHIRNISGTEHLRKVSSSIHFGAMAMNPNYGVKNRMGETWHPELDRPATNGKAPNKNTVQITFPPKTRTLSGNVPKKKIRLAYTIEFYAKIFYPFLFIIYNIIYWVVYLG